MKRNFIIVALAVSGLVNLAAGQQVWTIRNPGTTNSLHSVTYGDSQFVAVGRSNFLGTVLSSQDGITWTTQNIDTIWELYSVTYGDSQFVAVGEGRGIISSRDGITWTIISKSYGIDFHGNIARYSLSSSSTVSMKLYDTRGRRISELVNRIQNAGEHSIAMPSNIPSGIYVLALKAGNIKTDRTVAIGRIDR